MNELQQFLVEVSQEINRRLPNREIVYKISEMAMAPTKAPNPELDTVFKSISEKRDWVVLAYDPRQDKQSVRVIALTFLSPTGEDLVVMYGLGSVESYEDCERAMHNNQTQVMYVPDRDQDYTLEQALSDLAERIAHVLTHPDYFSRPPVDLFLKVPKINLQFRASGSL